MNRVVSFSLFLLFIGIVWIACKRVDDEPQYPPTPISRLYLSYSDQESSDTQQLYNVEVFDPADGEELPAVQRTRTRPNQGMGITFSPDLGLVFQVSRLDTTIMSFAVSETGNLTPSRTFKDILFLSSPRSIRYDNRSDRLFITNDNADSASLSIYYNPVRLVNQQPPTKKIRLSAAPWGLSIAAPKSSPNDSLVLLTMRGETGQIWGFNKRSLIGGEQFVSADPDYTLTINGASDLRGIAYARNLDMLFVTDLGPETNNATADGKVYVIENAAETIRAGGAITPSRIISGNQTTLADPSDVAVADSTDRNQFIYVSDRFNRRLLRFDIDANRNVSPNANTLTKLTLTPEFIYLDVR